MIKELYSYFLTILVIFPEKYNNETHFSGTNAMLTPWSYFTEKQHCFWHYACIYCLQSHTFLTEERPSKEQ